MESLRNLPFHRATKEEEEEEEGDRKTREGKEES